ncbi:IclR family transcriptional regulator [Diplocloster hominis]|uniref:IclR family transcriptional regulator n=1 Tax=Diplocloster hominis TaxID=3079010 RepID=UPI0031BAC46E
MERKKSTPKNVERLSLSAEKLLLIMEYLASKRLPVRLQDASEDLKIPEPTLLRYFNALIKHNYLYQDEDSLRYSLTWKICSLGQQINSYLSIRSICGPYLNDMAYELSSGVCLAVMKDYESIYLDLVDNTNTFMRSLQRIGKRAPLHTTASGKVLLTQLSEREIEGFIQVMGLKKITEKTITEKNRFLKELDTIRQQGYAYDDEECEIGIRCVSAPLRDYKNDIVAAISSFDDSERMTDSRIQGIILPKLLEMTEKISIRLGYTVH